MRLFYFQASGYGILLRDVATFNLTLDFTISRPQGIDFLIPGLRILDLGVLMPYGIRFCYFQTSGRRILLSPCLDQAMGFCYFQASG